MAIGKEIKVVLTLDTSSFDAKSKASRESVSALNTVFSEVGKTSSKLDTLIATLTKGFGALAASSKSLESIVSRADNVSGSMGKLARETKKVNLEWIEIGAFTPGVERGLNGVGKSAASTAVSIAQLKPSLAAAALGFKELDTSATTSAKLAKDMATQAIESKLAVLNNERTTNAAIIASRESSLKALQTAQDNFNGQAMAKGIEADAVRRTKVRGSALRANLLQGDSDKFANSTLIAKQEATAIEALLPKLQQEQALRLSGIKTLEAERAEILSNIEAKKSLASVADYVGKKNADEVNRIIRARAETDKQADKDSMASNRALEAERMASMRRLGAEQKAQALATAQIFKSMGAMWAAAKVEKGIGATIKAADNMEKVKAGVKALQLPGTEEAELYGSAEAMSKNLGFISQLDAIKSRMSAISSIGENNKKMIDDTLPTIVKAANNLEYMGYGHGDMQSSIRNIYGIVEMRQLTADAERTKDTANIVQKIVIGTAGKVQPIDLETVLRRMGLGASQMSDQGLVNIAAIVDQFKVAGGSQGGSGGGVSTVGTMIKMFQSYALGKTITNEAVKEFSGAGILNESGLDFSQDKAKVFKDAKNVGLKNADLWLKNPVAAMQEIFPKIIEYTKKNKALFYEGTDPENHDAQMIAFSKYLARMGITTTAQAGAVVMADPKSAERIKHQNETINRVGDVEQVDKIQKETYGRQMLETKVILTDIATLVGNQLLPPLKAVLEVVRSILGSFRDFATNNPMETQFLAVTAAVGGTILGVSALATLFGAGGLTGLVSTFGTTAATALPSLAGLLEIIGGWVASLLSPIRAIALSTVAWLASFGAVGGFITEALALAVGSPLWVAFAAMMGWTIGTWIKDIDVGGLTIQQHMENVFLNITSGFASAVMKMTEVWHDFKKFLLNDSPSRGNVKPGVESAENEASDILARKRRAEYEATMRLRPKMSDKDAEAFRAMDRGNQRTSAPKSEVDKNIEFLTADAANKRNDAAFKLSKLNDKPVGGTGGGRLAAGAPDKEKRPEFDPLNKALGEAQGKLNSQAIQLKALIVGAETLNDLKAEAAAEVEGRRVAGDYDKGRDPNKRPAADSAEIKELVERIALEKLHVEQLKALTFGNERIAAATLEANDAMERLTDNVSTKQTDAFRALNRELDRAASRLGAGATEFNRWKIAKDMALFQRARADLGNFAADMIDTNKADAAAFLPTEQQRVAAGFDASEKKQTDHYAMLAKQITKKRDDLIAGLEIELEAERKSGDESVLYESATFVKIQAVRDEYNAMTRRAETLQTEHLKLEAEKRQRALEDPIVGMARKWKDTYAELNALQVSWADGFVNTLVNGLNTGKLEFGQFVKKIILDLATVKLKEMLADPLRDVIGAGTDFLKQSLFPGAERKRILGAFGNEAASGAGDIAAEKASEIADEAAKSLEKLSDKTAETTSALSKMATDGAEKATEALVQSAATAATEDSASMVFAETLNFASAALEEFIATLESSGGVGGGGSLGGLFGGDGAAAGGFTNELGGLEPLGALGFANGGIMTDYGSLQLRKYATGGIARSPQLALYGEAGVAEAYVPLPDGRSIPVTMQGGAGIPPITVNVINQSGTQVGASKGEPRFDGRQMVLDVVLSAASSPGPFRDGLKGAVGGR